MVNGRVILVTILAIGDTGVVKGECGPEGGAVAVKAIAGIVVGGG